MIQLLSNFAFKFNERRYMEVGSVSIRNTKNILFKNLMDICCSTVFFFLFGRGATLLYSSSQPQPVSSMNPPHTYPTKTFR
jgi:hypothetical protein